MRKNSLSTFIKNIDNQLFELINHVICSVCQELLNKPVTTPCGHSFCSACIKRVISTKENSGCPLCKNPVKRYSLEDNKAKFTLSKICQGLPAAFFQDVKELQNQFEENDDLLRTSKMAQVSVLECTKEVKSIKRKKPENDKQDKNNQKNENADNNDALTFVPVLKRSKKVLQYMSAKKKKLEDFISISQTEAVSTSSTCESNDLDKKLDKIEKVPAHEKVKEWFKAVGDNMFLKSLSSPRVTPLAKNIISSDAQNEVNDELERGKKTDKSSSMIRIDYNKSTHSGENEKDKSKAFVDPYEFIPSQNNNFLKRKKRSIGKKKKMTGYCNIQNFTKESIKRNQLLMNESKLENEVEREEQSILEENEQNKKKMSDDITMERSRPRVTASQKFDKLLSDSKESGKKENINVHTLYSGSQSTSTQFLDCSGIPRTVPKNHSNRTGAPMSSSKQKLDAEFVGGHEESVLFRDCTLMESKEKIKNKRNSLKRKRSSEVQKGSSSKKAFSNILNLDSPDALELENSVEKYLKDIGSHKKERKKMKILDGNVINNPIKHELVKSTKLLTLLEELIRDDVIYKNRSYLPIKLPKAVIEDLKVVSKCFKPNKIKVDIPVQDKNVQSVLECNLSHDGSKTVTPGKLNPPQMMQATELIGFGTQEELPEEKKFKKMVQDMENELNSTDFGVSQDQAAKEVLNVDSTSERVNRSNEANISSNDAKGPENIELNPSCTRKAKSQNFVSFTLMGKIRRSKNCFISFMQLGRLTPKMRRSRSSVVKLVFPLGFSSFSRKRLMNNRCAVGVQSSQAPCPAKTHSSPDFEPPRKRISSASVQTSQVLQSSVIVQTSQREKTSVEVQASQGLARSIGNQTSQIESSLHDVCVSPKAKECKSMEIQTSQVPLESVHVQTIPSLSKIVFPIESQTVQNVAAVTRSTEIYESDGADEHLTGSETQLAKKVISSPSRLEGISFSGTENKLIALVNKNNHFAHKKIIDKNYVKCDSDDFTDCSDLSVKFYEKNNSKKIFEDDLFRSKSNESFSIAVLAAKGELDCSNPENNPKTHIKLDEIESEKHSEEPVDPEIFTARSESDLLENCGQISPRDTRSLREQMDKYENPKSFSLDIKQCHGESQVELVDLETQDTNENVDVQMIKVLKNIDLDLINRKTETNGEGDEIEAKTPVGNKYDKNEESDSDFFVEQTPPRQSYLRVDESRYSNSRMGNSMLSCSTQRRREEIEKADPAGFSVPKAPIENESFLVLSAPEHNIRTPKKSERLEKPSNSIFAEFQVERHNQRKSQGFPKGEQFSNNPKAFDFPGQNPNENDQNQLNAADDEKSKKHNLESKADRTDDMGIRKKCEGSGQKNSNGQKRKSFCIVASSVKNLETIKKFVVEFKLGYSNKPVKDMTHLIVGLHESDEGEVLPLCTPKLLFAMANKKWVVSESWAESCLKAKTILPEDNFETCDPIGGPGCRNARLSADHLFKNCEIHLLGKFQNILKEELADLISDSGGTLISKPENFSFSSSIKIRMIIADKDCLNLDAKQLRELYEKYGTVILSRDIIIMSIQSHKLSNFSPYMLINASEKDLIGMGYPSDLIKQDEDNWSCFK